MNSPLAERNLNIPRPALSTNLKENRSEQHLIEDVLAVSMETVDFGECVCGTVHEKKLGILMLTAQEQPRIIALRVVFEDESLA